MRWTPIIIKENKIYNNEIAMMVAFCKQLNKRNLDRISQLNQNVFFSEREWMPFIYSKKKKSIRKYIYIGIYTHAHQF